MKPFMLICALLLCGILVVPLRADADPEATVLFKAKRLNQQTLAIQLVNLQQRTTMVTLTNTAGEIFYQEVVTKHNGFVKRINLEKLPEGLYELIVQQGTEKMTRLIKMDGTTVLYSKVCE